MFRAFLVLFAVASPALSLDLGKSMTQYAHRVWGQEEGLFQPTVYSILQTRDGFLWLGTQDSLIRFDGIHFREFAEGQSILHGSLIRALTEGQQGDLWAGTLGGGVVRISSEGAVNQYSTANGLPSNSIFCLNKGRDGSIWAGTAEGLARISAAGVHTFSISDGLPFKRVRATCEAGDGTRWVAGLDFGLSHSDGSRFVRFSGNGLAESESVTALQCSSDGSVWAGTPDGLVHIAGSASRRYSSENGLPDDEVLALTQSSDGALWIGTNNGISRLHNGEISVYRTRDGLSHSQVLALALDREGSLWAGTKNGLDQFTDGKVTPYTSNEGLLSNDVGPVVEDANGRLWLGTLGRGLNFFDGRRFRSLTSRDGLSSNTILSLALDPDGDLWVGTSNGLNRIHSTRVVASFGKSSGLQGHEIRAIFVDAQNSLWVGTEKGLHHFQNGRFVHSPPPSKRLASPVIALSGGHSVPLFASFDGPGLYLLRDGKFSHPSVETTRGIDCFFSDHKHRELWMGTLGSGLLRWKNDRVSHVYVKDGLYDNRIYSILEDDASNFWLASSKGIFRLSHEELDAFADGKRKTVTSLPFSTGQLRFECQSGVQPAACRTRDGKLWFSTTGGLVVLDPNNLRREGGVSPPVTITAMIANGTRLSFNRNPHLKPLDENNLEIRYAGLSFISPEKVTFRYRLVGYDRSWIDAGTRREAFYTNLPPGRFDFLVQARNADGVWSAKSASLQFVVEPKLYQRAWFAPVLLLGLALAIAAGYRMRIRRLRNRFTLILAERTRIARELHDTLLQGLSGITMQLQALWTRMPPSREKRVLAEIIADAGHCSAEARQSLWGLRNNTPGDLEFSERLAKLAREAVSDRPMSLSLKVEPVTLRKFPDAEYQLLRIASEAITNALKHAAASQLCVALSVVDRVLKLTVEDNGTGFSPDVKPPGGHFGLHGMRERVEEIGGELSIDSSPENGTRVLVFLELPEDFEARSNPAEAETHQLQ